MYGINLVQVTMVTHVESFSELNYRYKQNY